MNLIFMLGIAVLGDLFSPFVIPSVFIGIGVLVFVIYISRKESRVPDDPQRAVNFKTYIELIDNSVNDKDSRYIEGFRNAWYAWRSRKEFQAFFNAATRKASHTSWVLQDSWDKYKDPKVPRLPPPSYILPS